jgi:hypothetical protein
MFCHKHVGIFGGHINGKLKLELDVVFSVSNDLSTSAGRKCAPLNPCQGRPNEA